MDNSVLEKVKKVVAARFNVSEENVTENLRFVEDLNADSLDSVEMMMQFEDDFGIEIPDEDSTKITTVGEAVAYISGIKGEKN